MNLKQLEVFLAVAETGSFSQGAEATFITQSTVSLHISSLEKEFGVKLLDRTGKGALLTEGGKVFRQHARQVVVAAQEIALAMNRFRGVEYTTLCIGGSNIPGDYIIPEILSLLLARFPSLTVNMIQGDSREILAKIRNEEIETGIIGSWFDNDDFILTPVGNDVIRLVVGKKHRWHGRKAVGLEELQEEAFILRESGSGTGKTVAEALVSAGMNIAAIQVKARLGSNEAIKQAVMNGLGISFISQISINKELSRKELAAMDVSGVNLSRHFYLVQRKGRELSPAAHAFVEIARKMHSTEKA
ncbi:selenium metabolism-associated LysR family transcriptional regulator [Geotalea toluenoxydans]